MKKILLLVCIFLAVTGCSHKYQYTKPKTNYDVKKSKIVNMSKDKVWSILIPKLSETFFVINNLDKESGLINVSYSGDPQNYVDCGEIYSYIQNLAGKREYRFPASKTHQEYEIWLDQLMPVIRNMNLEGRINIIIQEIEPEKTSISVNSKYILTKETSMLRMYYSGYATNSSWQKDTESFSFNTGGTGIASSGGTQCICNGELEKSILDLVSEEK